jgi:hypothetical protein
MGMATRGLKRLRDPLDYIWPAFMQSATKCLSCAGVQTDVEAANGQEMSAAIERRRNLPQPIASRLHSDSAGASPGSSTALTLMACPNGHQVRRSVLFLEA